MNKILQIFLLALLLSTSNALAATWYIASDGGTGVQCDGHTDHALAGASGTNCRLNSLYWVLPRSGASTTRQMSGGDTVVVEGSDQAGTGSYRIGCQNATNCQDSTINLGSGQNCDASQSYNCILQTIPSGTSGAHTKIIGCTTSGCGCASTLSSNNWTNTCTHPRPELWGAGALYQVLDVTGSSFIDLQDLEITDHGTCGYGHPTLSCGSTGNHPTILDARDGIEMPNSSDISYKGLNIHGLMRYGMYGGSVGNHTYDNLRLYGNAYGGINYDSCNNDGTCGVSQTKTMMFKNGFAIDNNGCIENSSSIGTIAATGCYDSNASGYGDGIGATTGSGTWTFTDGELVHNSSDGIDLGYINGTGWTGGSATLKRVRSEGNQGQQLKTDNNVYVEDSYLIGNCGYFIGQTFTQSAMSACRGSSVIKVSNTVNSGTATAKYYNNTITSNDDVMFDAGDLSGSDNCAYSFTIDIRNNLLLGGQDYNGGDNTTAFYKDTGCSGAHLATYSEDYNTCSTNFKTDQCAGAHDLHPIAASSTYSGTINQGPTFYTGLNYINELSLKSTSTAIGAANASLSGADSYGWGSQDRGVIWDMGALDYAAGVSPVCGNSAIESGENCDDGNAISGDGCSSVCAVESNWSCIGSPSVCTYTSPSSSGGGSRRKGKINIKGKSSIK